jgi:FkbM family methyltransferase
MTVGLSRSRLASHLGVSRLKQIEKAAQLGQGKGWGSSTVREEISAVCGLLGLAAVDPLVVVDAGANVGGWTLGAIRRLPQAHVHAFEPSGAASERLAAAVAGESRVSIHRIALSNEDGQAILYANEPGSPIASLTKRRLAGIDNYLEETVHTRTLSAWADETGIPSIDVLKLDVEGHELDVLRGAEDLLRDLRVLQFEFGGCNIDTRTYFQDFWYFLTEAGLEIYRLGPGGLNRIREYSERDEMFVTTNYFATATR